MFNRKKNLRMPAVSTLTGYSAFCRTPSIRTERHGNTVGIYIGW